MGLAGVFAGMPLPALLIVGTAAVAGRLFGLDTTLFSRRDDRADRNPLDVRPSPVSLSVRTD